MRRYVRPCLCSRLFSLIGQHHLYSFNKDEKHNYEIDFLPSRGNKIVPIEVKSSGHCTHKSLDAFCEKYASRIGDRILLYTKDYQQDGQTQCIPFYMTALLWNVFCKKMDILTD
ncbi:MAG: hypothetical protein J6T03_03020 [Bacteroidales bacterium]|nr:hypothetical protein [Bacteroidales bacterium]